jgi:hypothetical protein
MLRSLRSSDRVLLRYAIARSAPDSLAYEHSWGYVIQAARDRGMIFYDDSDGSLVVFANKPGHPDTLVVPTFLAEPGRLRHVVRQVQMSTGAARTVVKNVDPAEVDHMESLGFRRYRADEAWSATARFDDQTHPQPVVDLADLVARRGRAYRPLRRALAIGHAQGYRVRSYRKADKPGVLAIFAARDAEEPDNRFRVAHEMYLTHELERIVVEHKGHLVGFAATSAISESSAALCAGLFVRGCRALAAWSQYQVMAELHGSGFEMANLGGSEGSGTAQFKKLHFRPRMMIWRIHLVYE